MMQQGSPEWIQSRLGKVTASRISDVIAKTKSGYSASRKNYLSQLVVERLTGEPYETYQNAAMLRGIELEPEAREMYEFLRGVQVEQVGFLDHPDIAMSGASPDGLVKKDGSLEIKCPNTATHIDTLLSEKIDDKYIVQMQWQMECANRKWCDFVSYDPRLPADLMIFIKRVKRDDERIDELKTEVSKLLDEVESTLAKLNKLRKAA